MLIYLAYIGQQVSKGCQVGVVAVTKQLFEVLFSHHPRILDLPHMSRPTNSLQDYLLRMSPEI